MSFTRSKVEEARFFLGHMEKARTKLPDFDYFLNAFIGSARSVLWVMRAEYQEITGWKQWYDGKQLSPKEKAFFASINEVRTRSVKLGTLAADLVAIVDIPSTGNPAAFLPTNVPGRVELIPLDGSERTKGILKARPAVAFGTLKATHLKIDEFPDEDIASVCRRYLQRLESLVDECEKTYAL